MSLGPHQLLCASLHPLGDRYQPCVDWGWEKKKTFIPGLGGPSPRKKWVWTTASFSFLRIFWHAWLRQKSTSIPVGRMISGIFCHYCWFLLLCETLEIQKDLTCWISVRRLGIPSPSSLCPWGSVPGAVGFSSPKKHRYARSKCCW